MTPCRYFDGVSSRARSATIERDGTGVRILGDEVDRRVAGNALRIAPASDRGPARIAFADGGLCEIADRDGADALFAALGHRLAATDRFVSRTWQVLAVTAAFVVVVAALYRWGIPWASDRIVDRAPPSWDQALGEQILETLDQRHLFRPTAVSQAEQDRIVRRFAALRLPPDAPTVRILFRQLGAPNALALPGGIVVVTDEIVRIANSDDDALATVLAHEVGHVAHRDALRQLARSTIASGLAAWYFGDVSNAAAIAAGSLGSLSYSRDAEHEADLYAVRTMRANGVSMAGAGRLFRRLLAWTPSPRERQDATPPGDPTHRDAAKDHAGEGTKDRTRSGEAPAGRRRLRFPEYLSTHPDTDGRIRLFESEGASEGEGP